MNMTKAQLLEEVKTALGYTGSYHDGSIGIYIDEVKQYLASIDVPAAVLNSDAVVGIITMGVDSLRETGGLSEYFMQRAIQLRLTPVEETEETEPEPETKKMVKLCGITPIAAYVASFDETDPNDIGIFQYGDVYFIKFSCAMTANRDIKANTQIKVGKIDDEAYYPITDLYMPGYCTIGNEVMTDMFRVWQTGDVSVVTPAEIPTGEYFHPALSSEYAGVK